MSLSAQLHACFVPMKINVFGLRLASMGTESLS